MITRHVIVPAFLATAAQGEETRLRKRVRGEIRHGQFDWWHA